MPIRLEDNDNSEPSVLNGVRNALKKYAPFWADSDSNLATKCRVASLSFLVIALTADSVVSGFRDSWEGDQSKAGKVAIATVPVYAVTTFLTLLIIFLKPGTLRTYLRSWIPLFAAGVLACGIVQVTETVGSAADITWVNRLVLAAAIGASVGLFGSTAVSLYDIGKTETRSSEAAPLLPETSN